MLIGVPIPLCFRITNPPILLFDGEFRGEGGDEAENVGEFFLIAGALGHLAHLGAGHIVRMGAARAIEEFLELGGEIPIGKAGERGALEGEFSVAVEAVAFHAQVAIGEKALAGVAAEGGGGSDGRESKNLGDRLGDGFGGEREDGGAHLLAMHVAWIGAPNTSAELGELFAQEPFRKGGDGGSHQIAVSLATRAVAACADGLESGWSFGGGSGGRVVLRW